MANPWLNFPDNVPDDQEEVWVRVKYFSYNTFKCIWDSTAQTFTTSNTEIVYPAWSISKFKRII